MEKPLAELRRGEEGQIVAVRGGPGMQRRLRMLGLESGQRVRKLSALAWGGPIIVMVNRAQVAVGRGMAGRILIRTTHAETCGRSSQTTG